MPTILGLDRFQITFSTLEDTISADNEVRFIDAFVDKFELKKMEIKLYEISSSIKEYIDANAKDRLQEAVSIKLKLERYGKIDEITEEMAIKAEEVKSTIFPQTENKKDETIQITKKDSLDITFIGKTTQELYKYNLRRCHYLQHTLCFVRL